MKAEATNSSQDTQLIASNESEKLHSYIVNGDIQGVKTFLSSKTHSQPYLNENGSSAAYVAIKCRQFDIYSLLLSHDIRFVSDDERRILKEISREERSEFSKTLDKNSKEIKDAALNFLLSNTTYVNNESSDEIKIEKYFKELNEIPEIGLIFSVIKCSGFVKIIFDFEQQTVADIEPTAGKVTLGICHPKEAKLLIGAKRDNENELKGTIAHELTHYAMQIVYSNDCNPYHFNDNEKQAEFDKITCATKTLLDGKNSDIKLDEIINLVFRYRQSEWSSELIVRVNQMLAFHGKQKGEILLNEQASKLLNYYRENVMSNCKQFVRDSYLLKPKTEVEIFNLSSGLITRIKDSAITFINSYKCELEKLIKSKDNSLLLISTPSSILSAVKLFQSANELNINLNQYILIDFDCYLKQQNATVNLLRSASCILLILNISNKFETKNVEANWQQLLNHLSNILKTNPKFKIAIVFNENKLASILKPLSSPHDYKYQLIMDTNLGYTNLATQARLHVLKKKTGFQGEQILLETLTKNSRHLIDAYLLTKLIYNEKINIGSSIQIKNFNPHTYISRELNLTNEDGNESKMDENELIEKLSNNKVIIIADFAGSGKTTLLTHISLLIKQQFQHLWVVRVNLNSFTSQFKMKLETNEKQFSSKEAVEFLVKSQQCIDDDTENADYCREFFKSNLNRVVVMFDGFDEINPDYAETVLSLVKATMDSKVKQIFLTTRPECKTMLEKQFNYKPIQISPLNEEIQMQYLVTYWKYKLNIVDKDSDLETLALKMRQSIFYINNSTRRENFFENPLQLMLFAEASLDKCEELLRSSPSILSVQETLRKADLYEKFISKKLDVYQVEKMELDPSKIGARIFFSKKNLVEIHQVAALKRFYSSIEVETLLSTSHIKQDNGFPEIAMLGIIINFTNERPEFVHQTFAEYFVAKFITDSISQQQITKKIAEIILKTIFLQDHFETIRSFVNEMLTAITAEMICHTQVFVIVWEECFINVRKNPVSVALHEENDKIVQLLCSWFNNTTFMSEILGTTSIAKMDTLLHLAAKTSNQRLIKMLIDDHEVYVDIVNEENETPLNVACQFSVQDVIKMLIDSGADIKKCNHYNQTSLHLAASNNSTEVVRMLIDDYGLKVNAVDYSGITPLHSAAKYNNIEIVKLLIDHYKADVNTVDNDGNTTLHWAADNNGKEVIKMLIEEYEAKVKAVDNDGRTPLHTAAKYNNKEVVKMLIDYGSDVNAVNSFGRTPLFRAARFNSKNVVQMFVDCGAIVNAVDNAGSTPLHCAAKYNNKEVVKMLIDYNATLNAVDNIGRTPLHCAAKKSRGKEVIQMLIDAYKADPNAVDKDGRTPLHWAAGYNGKEVVQTLIVDYKANVNVTNNGGNTPLHDALHNNNKDVIKVLIDHEANVSAVNDRGMTPLDVAKVRNHKGVIQILVKECKVTLNG